MHNTNDTLPKMNLQLFAEGDGGADTGDDKGTDKGTDTKAPEKAPENDSERIEKYIQSKIDKALAEERKKTVQLQKQLEKANKDKMTDEEIRQHEISEREKTIAERERALTEKENRLFAIKAIKEAGLDDGSSNALNLVDFVMAEDEEAITNKVKAFSSLVNKFVKDQVEATFKKNGRNPEKGGNNEMNNDNNSLAAKLGKTTAERNAASNKVLDHYLGR